MFFTLSRMAVLGKFGLCPPAATHEWAAALPVTMEDGGRVPIRGVGVAHTLGVPVRRRGGCGSVTAAYASVASR